MPVFPLRGKGRPGASKLILAFSLKGLCAVSQLFSIFSPESIISVVSSQRQKIKPKRENSLESSKSSRLQKEVLYRFPYFKLPTIPTLRSSQWKQPTELCTETHPITSCSRQIAGLANRTASRKELGYWSTSIAESLARSHKGKTKNTASEVICLWYRRTHIQPDITEWWGRKVMGHIHLLDKNTFRLTSVTLCSFDA